MQSGKHHAAPSHLSLCVNGSRKNEDKTEVAFHVGSWAGTYRYQDPDLGRGPITSQTPLGYVSPSKPHPIPSLGAPRFPQ